MAWMNASTTAGATDDPMANAQGAAGSYLAILLHLGWTAPFFELIRTTDVDQKGNIITLDLLATCPRVTMPWAKLRLNEIDAAKSQLCKKIGGPPDLEPLAEVLKGKKLRDSNPMKSLRAMGEGGWRCQADLFSMGLVDDDRCQACFLAEGTFHHRCVGCSARKETRDAYKNQKPIRKAQSELRCRDPLYQFGVPIARPRTPRPDLQYDSLGERTRANFSLDISSPMVP